MKAYVLDKKPKKIWSLNQLRVGDFLTGIPHAEHWKNKKNNEFIKIGLDYGHATCSIFCLVFDFPFQKLLHKKYTNSFELARFYREANNIPVDKDITQLHNINWKKIIDWLNSLHTLKIQVVSKNMNGFKNIRFVRYTDKSLYEFFDFKQNWRMK